MEIRIDKIKRINLSKVDDLFYTYEGLVISIARKIYNKLYFLPPHIKEEFIHEARYSLIKTLNDYNKKYYKTFRRPVSLRTEITWKCYDHLSDWWSRSYCGCRKWITQKKHKLLPRSKEEMESFISDDWDMESVDGENNSRENLIEKEENVLSSELLEYYRKKLKINRKMFDCLIMNFYEYDQKYPGYMTKKCLDNTHQSIRRKVLNYLDKDKAAKLENNQE